MRKPAMHPQNQSPFFSRLPPEVRAQVQVEYLAAYLRETAVAKYDGGGQLWLHNHPHRREKGFSTPISSLTLSCKRMYGEMRESAGSLAVGRRFGVFLVRRNRTAIFLSEGRYEARSLRHLRFIHEMDEPDLYCFLDRFRDLLEHVRELTELELEWNPMMSVVPHAIHEVMRSVSEHPAIHTVRLRGNFPISLLELKTHNLGSVRVTVEPLVMWRARNEELKEDEDIRQKALKRIATNKGQLLARVDERVRFDIRASMNSRQWFRYRVKEKKTRLLNFWGVK